MKKKMNYLILLLTIIFMVGCTELEDASVTDSRNRNSQEANTVETNKDSVKEEPVTTVVDEPVVVENRRNTNPIK